MARFRRTVPTGTVTFLFSDIEGSTQLVQELDSAGYRELLEQHQRLLRVAFAAHGGVERGTEGDSFFVVFRDAPSAVAAAVEAQRSLQTADWPQAHEVRVRVGLHSGEGILGGDVLSPLRGSKHLRVDLAAEGHLRRVKALRNLPEGHVADHHDIDIAARDFLAASDGSVHECNVYGSLRG